LSPFRHHIGLLATNSLAFFCCFASPADAKDIDPPHHLGNGYTCATCHTMHESLGHTGYNNICADCHKPGVPRGGAKPFLATDAADPFNTYTAALTGRRFQTSHRWDGPDTAPQAGAQPPVFPAMTSNNLRGRTGGALACVRCHNQHDNTLRPFLRMANDNDQLCLNCHSSRNQTSHTAGTHPVNVPYSSAKPKHNPPVNANPANPTSAMLLKNGKVLCTTCHGVHYADSNSATFDSYSSYNSLAPADGFLLRTDLHGASADSVNICTNCHDGKKNHNGKSQNVQCPDCHAGHVDYDPSDPGGTIAKNTFLVRRYMNISTGKGAVRHKRVLALNTLDTDRAYRNADGTGVCQACHAVPSAISAHSASNPSTASYCNGCHIHNDPKGAFTVNCASCHGYPPTTAILGGPDGLANPATNGVSPLSPGAHAVHATTRNMGCEVCHNGYGSKPMPSNTIDLGFAINGTTYPGFAGSVTTGTVTATTGLNAPYTWSSGASPGTTVNLPGAVNPGCANIYCHGATLTGGTNTSPSWVGGPSQAACGTCHGASTATPPTTGSHTRHAASGAGNLGLACSTCHPNVTDGSHVNGSVAWSLDVSNPQMGSAAQYRGAPSGSTGTLAPSASYGACSTTYCHGAGTPVWGTVNTNTDCTWCHGGNAASSAPMTKDRHGAHMNQSALLGSNYGCAQCHSTTVSPGNDRAITGAVHVNGTRDVSMLLGGTWDPAAKNCFTVYCHSNGKGTYANPPAWTSATTLGCNGCHGTSNPQGAPDYASGAPGSASANSHGKHVLSSGIACGECHYLTTRTSTAIRSDVVPSRHTNTVTSDVFFNLSGNSKSAVYTPGNGNRSCSATYCHGTNTPQWGRSTMPADCTGCHGGAAGSAAPISTGKHAAHLNNAVVLGTNFGCTDCHAKTVSGNTTIGTPANHINGFVDYSGARGGSNKPCATFYCHSNGKQTFVPPPAWTGATVFGCNGCHGTSNALGAPDYASGPAGSLTANSHAAHTSTGSASCDACHTNTTTTGTAVKGGSVLHINGAIDVTFNTAKAGGSISWTPGTKTCTNISCHGNTSGQWGASACLDCHSISQGNRAAITPQFSANSHHIQGTVANAHCYQCHWEANSDGTINLSYHGGAAAPGSPVELVVYGAGARPATYNLGVTAVAYTANGTRSEMAKINIHCLGCHSTQNDGTSPFGDGKTPKQYAWDSFSIGAKYGNYSTTPWGKYSGGNVTPKNTVTKAYSAHGNAVSNQGGWDTNETWPNTRNGAVNILCCDCHNSHGSGVSGTTTSYTSATANGGILKDTIAGKGGYSTTYKPAPGGSPASKNAYNPGAGLCFDCHLTANAGPTPWGYGDTFGAAQKIMGYWDTTYFGPGTFGSQSRFPYKTTPHRGGHFGAYTSLSTLPSKAIGGLCTPCHDPHGVSPALGANKKYAVPLLKGTWLTSPYKEDVSPANNTAGTERLLGVPYHIDQNTFGASIRSAVTGIGETDAQFAGLCLGCHAKDSLTNGVNGGTWKSVDRIHESVKGWGANAKHSYSCSKCHTPHNSRLPRLMVTNCLNYRHKGRVSYNLAPVISGGGSGDYNGCSSTFPEFCYYTWNWSGSGSGRIPGSFSGDAPGNYSVTCHENKAPDQGWNERTPWGAP
jgi:predicted CxxxxCH...CXXCH cytochrome family protein